MKGKEEKEETIKGQKIRIDKTGRRRKVWKKKVNKESNKQWREEGKESRQE